MNPAYNLNKSCLKLMKEFDKNSLSVSARRMDVIDIKQEHDLDMDDDDYYYVLVIDEEDGVKQEPIEESKIVEALKTPPKKMLTTIKAEPLELNPITGELNNLESLTKLIDEDVEDTNNTDFMTIANGEYNVNIPASITEEISNSNNVEQHQQQQVECIAMFTEHLNMQQAIVDHEEQQEILIEPHIIMADGDNSDGGDHFKLLNDTSNLMKLLGGVDTITDGSTLFLKSDDGQLIRYVTETEDGDEVILCEEGEEEKFQIVNYDGTDELVIEYADESQVATVIQQDDGTYICSCGDILTDLGNYEEHQAQHREKKFCDICNKEYDTEELYAKHMLLHDENSQVMMCPFCLLLIRRHKLAEHMRLLHNMDKPRCRVCQKTFANTNNLKRHLSVHLGQKSYECDVCWKQFTQKDSMMVHKLKHINDKISPDEEEMKTLGYACTVCGEMFELATQLQLHVCESQAEVTIEEPTSNLCSDCGELLPTKKLLQAHMQHHKPSLIKRQTTHGNRFICSVCEKVCTSHAMLIMHERVHTNERPYPCSLCSLRFKTKTHLRTHHLTHTHEKRFGCSVCMKFFALKGNLVVHLRTHTGERPYVCSLCGEAFIDSKYLKSHKKRKHNIDNVPWYQYN